jgi:hypothetical protein
MLRRWRWWLLALLVVASCAIAACYSWAEPSGLPAAAYQTWWDELVACAGNKNGLALEGIRWDVRGEPEPVEQGRIRVGRWDPPNRIWIAESYQLRSWAVKHEMLHYLLQRGRHPTPPFGLCTEGVLGYAAEEG